MHIKSAINSKVRPCRGMCFQQRTLFTRNESSKRVERLSVSQDNKPTKEYHWPRIQYTFDTDIRVQTVTILAAGDPAGEKNTAPGRLILSYQTPNDDNISGHGDIDGITEDRPGRFDTPIRLRTDTVLMATAMG